MSASEIATAVGTVVESVDGGLMAVYAAGAVLLLGSAVIAAFRMAFR